MALNQFLGSDPPRSSLARDWGAGDGELVAYGFWGTVAHSLHMIYLMREGGDEREREREREEREKREIRSRSCRTSWHPAPHACSQARPGARGRRSAR